MPIKLANNASGTLATAINATDTGLILTTGDGAEFPALAAGEYFYLTLTAPSGAFEIVKATARAGDAMTVVRAQEGTTALGFSVGSRAELRVTAASVGDAVDEAETYALGLDNTLRGDLAASSGTSLVGFLQSGTSAVARTAQARLRDFVSVKDFGAVGDGVTDDYAAIMAAINSVTYQGTFIGGPYRAGPAIYFPPGIYYIGQTIELKKRVTMFGDGSGMAYGDAAILKFPADTTGIIVQALNTTGTTTGPSTTAGAASVFRGLAFVSAGGSDTTKHGIWLRGRVTIENCYIENFPGDGYHIEATAGGGGSAEGNANNWRISNGRVNDCGGSGLYVDGADANAGMCDGLDSSSNGGWGIWDSSFLGNTYVACHTASNGLGAYKTDNANARNVFLGCYSESGQPASNLVAPTLVLGGIHAADFVASTNSAYLFLDGKVQAGDGSASNPTHSYKFDKATGFWIKSAGRQGIAAAGAERGQFSDYAKFTSSGLYFSASGAYHELVQSSASNASSIEYITSTSYTGNGKYIKAETASGTGFNLITAAHSTGNCFTVSGNGNAQNTNNSYGAISDIKLKQDVVDASSQWDDVKAIRLRKYRFKAEPNGPLQLGVVAQELEEVSPGLVEEIPDRDDSGEPTGEFIKTVKYSVLMMKAVGALQEAQKRIESLEARVAALEAK